MSLRASAALSAVVFVLIGFTVVATLCLPLTTVIQGLSSETKPPARALPLLTRVLGSTPAVAVTAGLSVVTLVLAVAGLLRERTRRAPWVGLVAVDTFLLLGTLAISMVVVRLPIVWHDLGLR